MIATYEEAHSILAKYVKNGEKIEAYLDAVLEFSLFFHYTDRERFERFLLQDYARFTLGERINLEHTNKQLLKILFK